MRGHFLPDTQSGTPIEGSLAGLRVYWDDKADRSEMHPPGNPVIAMHGSERATELTPAVSVPSVFS